MRDLFRRDWLARLAGLVALGTLPVARGAGAEQAQGLAKAQPPAQVPPENNPSPIWVAMLKVLPEKYRAIDIYAENPSRTTILFRSQGETLVYNTSANRIQLITHPKPLGRVNQITFEVQSRDLSGFILWLDGAPQLTVLARR